VPEYNLIQRGDLILRLQQMLGVRQAHVVPSLAETVQAVVIMGDVRDEGSSRVVARDAWGEDAQGSFPANAAQVALANPLGSNVIITLKEARVQCPEATLAAVQRIAFGLEIAGDLGTPSASNEAFRNSRLIDPNIVGENRRPVGRMSHTLVGAPAARPYTTLVSTPAPVAIHPEVVIYPGWRCLFQSILLNTGLEVACLWREEDQETRA
jgi:hypothetical protein